MVDFLSFGFLPYLVCASEVTDNVHQDISACTYFVFSPGCILYMRLSPFSFHSFSSVALRCFEWIRLRFVTSLEFLYLRYFFSYVVFIWLFFVLRYRSNLGLLVCDFNINSDVVCFELVFEGFVLLFRILTFVSYSYASNCWMVRFSFHSYLIYRHFLDQFLIFRCLYFFFVYSPSLLAVWGVISLLPILDSFEPRLLVFVGLRLLYSATSIDQRSWLLRSSLFFSFSLSAALIFLAFVFGLRHAGVF